MTPEATPLSVLSALRLSVPDARALSVIRALLDAERVIAETFNGNSPGRADARLARGMAATLAKAADEHEAGDETTGPVRLTDLPV